MTRFTCSQTCLFVSISYRIAIDLGEDRVAWHVVSKVNAEDGSGQEGGSHADCGDEKGALHHDCCGELVRCVSFFDRCLLL